MWEVTWTRIDDGTYSLDHYKLTDAVAQVVDLAADREVENISLVDQR